MSLSELIKNRFGSKKGLLRYCAYESLRMVGFYKSLTKIDFSRVERLVFICQGNICRSPLAEAVALKQGVPAISFGLDTRGGDPADPRAIAWAQANGYNLQQHTTKRVDQYVPQQGDLLIGMEPKHIRKLQEKFRQAPVQMTLIGLWLESPLAYLHDPYNAKPEYFSRCEELVRDGVVGIRLHCGARTQNGSR